MKSPAHRSRLLAYKSRKSGKPKTKFLFPLVGLLLAVLYFFFGGKYWNGSHKLVLAIENSSGVVVSVFDPQLEEIVNIRIPGKTQVSVSRNLGSWRLESVWQLGLNEKIGPQLLPETITKNFKIGTYAWAGAEGTGFSEGEFIPIIRAVLLPYATNLSFADRVRLGLFSLGTTEIKRSNIVAEEGGLLKKTRLKDGSEGYVVTGDIPKSLLAIFADPKISEGGGKVMIKDFTGSSQVAENVGEIIEVLGAKVASISKSPQEESDCFVLGVDEYLVDKISLIFSCKKIKKDAGNFDLEIQLGKKFADRW